MFAQNENCCKMMSLPSANVLNRPGAAALPNWLVFKMVMWVTATEFVRYCAGPKAWQYDCSENHNF